MRFMQKLLGAILALAFFFALLTTSLRWVTFDLSFYERELGSLGVADDLQVDFPTLMGYVSSLTQYLKGQQPSPNLVTVVRGQEQWLYGEREIHHLKDVRHLFDLSAQIKNIALLIIVVILLCTTLLRAWPSVLRAYIWTAAGVAVLIGILGILSAIDFNHYFTIFHYLSFSNDLWLLDPATENLIVMFPEQFFAAAALRIALATVISYVITLLMSGLSYRKMRRASGGL